MAGHQRYAHINGIRQDSVHPQLLGVKQLVSKDAARRALQKIDEAYGKTWLDDHLGRATTPFLGIPWICDLDATKGDEKYLPSFPQPIASLNFKNPSYELT